MAQPKKQPINYQKLNVELEEILQRLQSQDIDIDVALKHYERGLVIVKQLESYLSAADNRVRELKTKFNDQP